VGEEWVVLQAEAVDGLGTVELRRLVEEWMLVIGRRKRRIRLLSGVPCSLR